jgi:omega-6 fatty acid desaturase (delta-12 desaturase)
MVDQPVLGLRQINPAYLEKNNVHGWIQVAMNMSFFFALLLAASVSHDFWLSLILVIIIGIASHRLFFPAHDCMHESLFKSKKINAICGYLLAGILGTPFHSMRDQHMLHHRHVGTEQDPGAGEYFVRFETRRQMVGFFIAPLLGFTVLTRLIKYAERFSLRGGQIGKSAGSGGRHQSLMRMILGILSVVGMQIILCAILSQGFQFGKLWRYPIFAVIPVALGFLFLNRIRMFLEHGSIDYSKSDYTIGLRPTNRSIIASPVERILICGGNFNYHNEHHRFPRVPGCNLRRLHEELLSEMDPWDSRATYIGTLTELWRNLSPARTQD